MSTVRNAYEVLRLCLEDPDYNHEDLQTDICGHIAKHMGRAHFRDEDGLFPWMTYVRHIGLEEYEHPLWQLLCAEVTKEYALKKFAEMIMFVHGPEPGRGVPENLRLF